MNAKKKFHQKTANVLATKLPSISSFFTKQPFWYSSAFLMDIFCYYARQIISVFRNKYAYLYRSVICNACYHTRCLSHCLLSDFGIWLLSKSGWVFCPLLPTGNFQRYGNRSENQLWKLNWNFFHFLSIGKKYFRSSILVGTFFVGTPFVGIGRNIKNVKIFQKFSDKIHY